MKKGRGGVIDFDKYEHLTRRATAKRNSVGKKIKLLKKRMEESPIKSKKRGLRESPGSD